MPRKISEALQERVRLRAKFLLNRDRIQAIRSADVVVDRHPPANDPIQESK